MEAEDEESDEDFEQCERRLEKETEEVGVCLKEEDKRRLEDNEDEDEGRRRREEGLGRVHVIHTSRGLLLPHND